MVTPYLPMLRAQQRKLMTESVRIVRGGSAIFTDVPARITQEREFTEPGDPHDGSLRARHEYGITMPYTYTSVRVSDVVEKTDGSLAIVVGEILVADTWITAVRVWGTRPKTASPHVTILFWRYSPGADDYVSVGSADVQLVFSNVQPSETPIRFSPAAQAAMISGVVVGDITFAPQVDDRFEYQGYAFVIDYILPGQPQRVEAHFVMDAVGSR